MKLCNPSSGNLGYHDRSSKLIKLNQVRVLFFGATADLTGEREINFPIESLRGPTVSEIVKKFPQLAQHKLLFSINQEYAQDDEILHDGDEVAIFTAVSGG